MILETGTVSKVVARLERWKAYGTVVSAWECIECDILWYLGLSTNMGYRVGHYFV